MLQALSIGKHKLMHQNKQSGILIVDTALNSDVSVYWLHPFIRARSWCIQLTEIFMHTNNLHHPSYKFQTQRQRQIWPPSVSWHSRAGRCEVIAKRQQETISVLLEWNGGARWMPTESEAKVVQWIRIAATNKEA